VTEALANKAYADLPEAIRHTLKPNEWAWLSDAEKARLMQTETEPEDFDR